MSKGGQRLNIAPLFVALTFASSFAVIAGSVGLNALVKSNQAKGKFKRAGAAKGVRVTINTDDTLHSGIVVSVVCAALSLIAFISSNMLFLGRTKPSVSALELRTRKMRAGLMAFFVIWLIPTQIAFTFFFATRSAIVRAFIGKTELPQSVIEEQAKALGSTAVYKELSYLRLLAVFPWIAIFFGIIAVVMLYLAPALPAYPEGESSWSGARATDGSDEKA